MVKKITIKDIRRLLHEEEKYFPKELDKETINYIREKENYKVKKNKSKKIINLFPFILKKKFIPLGIAASFLLLIFTTPLLNIFKTVDNDIPLFPIKKKYYEEMSLTNNIVQLNKEMEKANVNSEFVINDFRYMLKKQFNNSNGNSCYQTIAINENKLLAKNEYFNVKICKINGLWTLK